jgi:hypothetical protein
MHCWSAGAVTLICARLIFCHDFGVEPVSRVMADGVGTAGVGRDEIMSDLQTCILGRWMHSHEEDAEGVTVYRPADYAFPPSRGRTGFEFREGGELVYGGIARADGSTLSSGHWIVTEPNRISIEIDNERTTPIVLDVVDCSKEALRVKR